MVGVLSYYTFIIVVAFELCLDKIKLNFTAQHGHQYDLWKCVSHNSLEFASVQGGTCLNKNAYKISQTQKNPYQKTSATLF